MTQYREILRLHSMNLRLITHAEFYLSESGESLLDCM